MTQRIPYTLCTSIITYPWIRECSLPLNILVITAENLTKELIVSLILRITWRWNRCSRRWNTTVTLNWPFSFTIPRLLIWSRLRHRTSRMLISVAPLARCRPKAFGEAGTALQSRTAWVYSARRRCSRGMTNGTAQSAKSIRMPSRRWRSTDPLSIWFFTWRDLATNVLHSSHLRRSLTRLASPSRASTWSPSSFNRITKVSPSSMTSTRWATTTVHWMGATTRHSAVIQWITSGTNSTTRVCPRSTPPAQSPRPHMSCFINDEIIID